MPQICITSVLSCLETTPVAASMAVDRTGDDRPAPAGRNEVAGSGRRLFCFAMQSRLGRRRKKPPDAVAGRRAGFGQTSLWRGRVGGAAVQDHGPDGMIGGALPPPAVAVPRRSGARGRREQGEFRASEVRGRRGPGFHGGAADAVERCAAMRKISGRGAARASDGLRPGLCDAGQAPDSVPGCWPIWAVRAGGRSASPEMDGALPSPPSG